MKIMRFFKFSSLLLAIGGIILGSFLCGVKYSSTIRFYYNRHIKGYESFRTEFYESNLRLHRCLDGQVPTDSILFLGDSHFQRMYCNFSTIGGVNYGIGSDTTEGLLARLPDYKSLGTARAVILEIGCNDFAQGKMPKDIARNIEKICETLPETAQIFICSLLPGTDVSENLLKKDYNFRFKDVALRHNHTYVDFYSDLLNKDEILSPLFDSGDGVHLNKMGYDVLKKKLQEELSRKLMDK